MFTSWTKRKKKKENQKICTRWFIIADSWINHAETIVWLDTSRSTGCHFLEYYWCNLGVFRTIPPSPKIYLESSLKRANLRTKKCIARGGSRGCSRDANGSGIGTIVLIPASIKCSAVSQCQYAYRYINHPGSGTILNSTPKRIWRSANMCTKVLRLSRRMATFWKLNARCCYPRVLSFPFVSSFPRDFLENDCWIRVCMNLFSIKAKSCTIISKRIPRAHTTLTMATRVESKKQVFFGIPKGKRRRDRQKWYLSRWVCQQYAQTRRGVSPDSRARNEITWKFFDDDIPRHAGRTSPSRCCCARKSPAAENARGRVWIFESGR